MSLLSESHSDKHCHLPVVMLSQTKKKGEEQALALLLQLPFH